MPNRIKPKQSAEGTALDSKYNIPFYINTLPVVIWDFETLNIIDVNESAILKYGYTREEFLKINIREIRPPEDIALLEEITSSEDVYGSVHKRIWRHKKKSGEIMFAEISGYITTIDNKRVVIAHAYDVTERIESEKKLKESEERYKILFNKSPLPKLIFEISTFKIVEVNETAVINYGYSRDEFLSMTIYDYRPAKDFEKVNYVLSTIGNADEVHHFGTYDHIKKDGSIIKVDVTGYRLNYQNTDCLLVEFNDVTEQKLAEEMLKASFNERNAILESIDDGFFAIDNNWTVTYWNKRAEAIVKKSRDEIIGKDLREVYADIVLADTYWYYEKAFKEKVSQRFEAFYDKAQRWFEVAVYPSDTGLSVYFRDITQILDRKKTIELQNKKLLEVAWMQSHLTRAPVANILGLVNLIKNTQLSPEEKNELFDHIFNSATALDKVIATIVKQIDTTA